MAENTGADLLGKSGWKRRFYLLDVSLDERDICPGR
jgi:hypothetical protein